MSKDTALEEVPLFKRRVGDTVLQGSNNATIVLGTDRVDTVDSGHGDTSGPDGGKGAGSVTIVVGRAGQDLSPDDRASVVVSAKDTPEDGQDGSSAVTVIADCVRVVAREDVVVKVGSTKMTLKKDGSVTIDATDVSIGSGASPLATKADLESLKTAIRTAVPVATDGGASLQTTLLAALASWPVGTSVLKGK